MVRAYRFAPHAERLFLSTLGHVLHLTPNQYVPDASVIFVVEASAIGKPCSRRFCKKQIRP